MSTRRNRKRPLQLEDSSGGESSSLISNNQGSSDTESSIDRLTAVLSTFLESNVQRERTSAPVAQGGLIPIFDPEKREQTVVEWCQKVDELRSVFNWSEEATIYFAMSKLKGMAEVWYKALRSVKFTWDEWKLKLEESFPSQRDYYGDLQEMMNRTKRHDETYCKYYYEKLALLNSCEITGKKAVSCIIGGIFDTIVKTGAKAGNYATPESLYNYLCSIDAPGPSKKPHLSGVPQKHRSGGFKVKNANYKQSATVTCFSCNKIGHTARTCVERRQDRNGNSGKRCNFCRHMGHLEEECFQKKRKEKGKPTL